MSSLTSSLLMIFKKHPDVYKFITKYTDYLNEQMQVFLLENLHY